MISNKTNCEDIPLQKYLNPDFKKEPIPTLMKNSSLSESEIEALQSSEKLPELKEFEFENFDKFDFEKFDLDGDQFTNINRFSRNSAAFLGKMSLKKSEKNSKDYSCLDNITLSNSSSEFKEI
jgi:hypothetical protein